MSRIADNLNQIIQRGVPGAAYTDASVTVHPMRYFRHSSLRREHRLNFCGELLPSTGLSHGVNNNAAYRKGEYYQYALALGNGSGPVWQAVTNQAVKGGNTTTITNNRASVISCWSGKCHQF